MYNNMPNQNDNNSYGGNVNPSMSDYNSNNMSDTANSYTPHNNMPSSSNGYTPNNNMPSSSNGYTSNNSMPSSSNSYAPNDNPHPIDNGVVNIGAPKNKKTMVIIVAVVAILAIVGIYFIIHSMTSKGYKGGIDFEKEYQEKVERESKELANKVNVEYQKLPDGDYLIIIENKANKAIFPECTVEFYDDTTLTSTKEAYVKSGYILPNQKGYAILYNERDIKYNKLVPKVVSSYYEMKTYDANKLPYTVEKKSDNLVITVTNNTGEALDSINVDVLYYDSEDKIIGYGSDRISPNVTAGAANFVNIYLPEDENFNEIAYSRYEVIVSAEEKF